jgi:hypothetical protein
MLKNDKKDKLQLLTTKGKLTISRTVLRPQDSASMKRLLEISNIKSIAPLDIVLRIDDLPYKMTREMMCEVAFWGQNQSSFKSAALILKKVHGIEISDETVRSITDYVGKIVFEDDKRIANKTYDEILHIKYSRNKKGVLYIQTDGAALNTRTKDDAGSTWRENKLGIAFSSDNVRRTMNKKGEFTCKILKKEYTSYVGSVQEFKKHLFACAVRNGYGEYEETVLLGDGAAWIRNIRDELFPDAVQILDLFHLCENTYSYAKAIFKNDDSKYNPWAQNIIEMLENGEKQEVIKILKALKNRKIPKGTVNLYTYILNNIDKIDYKTYNLNSPRN